MATVQQYFNALRTTRNTLCGLLGVSFPDTEKTVRTLSSSDLACLAVVVKALTDKGVITDADLQAAQASALTGAWDAEPPLT